MAVEDYDTLKSEVQAWTGRSDSTFANRFPVFVKLAEDRIYLGHGTSPSDPLWSEPVRSKIMETTGTVAMTAGDGSLPDDCLGIRRVTRASDQVGLDYMSPDQLQLRLARNSGGDPGYYSVEGTTLRVAPVYTGDLTLLYFKRFDTVGPSNIDGAMIIEHGEVYFCATMFEAFSFMQEIDLATAWLARYRSAVGAINQAAQDLRYAGRRLRIHARPIA